MPIPTDLIIDYLSIMLINMLSNTTSTLKNIFASKRFSKPLYIITFFDAMIFAVTLQKVASGKGNPLYYVIAFSIGKLLGAVLGNFIEEKMALGIYEVTIFLNNKEKMKSIADELRDKGYSVNTLISYGIHGSKRYRVEVTILRKELKVLKEVLAEHDYEEPTFTMREVNTVNGKISVSQNT